MAYFIFLKSLRSLEEFRKNPHVKISPKSPCANFQSHGIFKNKILFEKEIFSVTSGPSGLSAQSRPILFFLAAPPSSHWASASRPAQPAHAPVAPRRIVTSPTGRRLQPRRLRPLFAPGWQWIAVTPSLGLFVDMKLCGRSNPGHFPLRWKVRSEAIVGKTARAEAS
jgi:hypothetical protein